MNRSQGRQRIIPSDSALLVFLALSSVLIHILTNGKYGFHRDELQTLDDAQKLAWGYVVYPPLTPFFGRLSLEIFGLSQIGVRFFPALALGVAILHENGAERRRQRQAQRSLRRLKKHPASRIRFTAPVGF